MLCFSIYAKAQVPFSCTGDFYSSLTPGFGNSSLEKITFDANGNVIFTTINSNIGAQINAIGYRVTDNLIYGVHPTQEDLYRIDATGTATFLANLSSINSSYSYFAGDVTPDGNFLVIIGRSTSGATSTSRNLVKIDLNSPTYAQTSISLINAATGTLNTTAYMSDIAFDPITGILYGYDNNNKRLVTIDMASGGINSTLYPTTTAWLLGAMFFDASGELFGYGRNQNNNTQDDFFYVDITTGITTFLTTGPGASGNDGCSCPFTVDFRKLIVNDIAHQCEEFDIRYQVVNTTGLVQSGLSIFDTLPSGFIITQIVSNQLGGTVTGIGTNQLSATGMTAPLGIPTLRIRVKAPATALGIYNSQAHLTGLPIFVGSSMVSDNPKTLLVDDPTKVTIIPSDLGENITACVGDTVNIGIDTILGGSYLWNNLATTSRIDVTQTNLYDITISNGTCVVYDTIGVTFNDYPIVNLGNDTLMCLNDNIVFDVTYPNVTYAWNDNSTNPMFTALDTGYYSVTITDGAGCADTSDIQIGYYQTILLPADEIFICDSTTFTITPNLTQGTFLWSTGETTATIAPTTADMYWLEYTNPWGCVSRDTMILTAPDIPIINLGNDTVVCLNQPIFLDATIPNAVSYLWQDGSTNATFNTTVAGTYFIDAENWHTCHAYDTIIVQQNEVIPFIGIDTTICHNTPLILNATQYNMTYVWHDGSTNPTFTVVNPGTYWVQLTDSISCVGVDSIVVGQHPITQVDLGMDLMYVCDSSTFTIYPNYTIGGFVWQDASTNPTFIANNIGIYTLQYTDANTCTSTDNIELYAPPVPSVNLGMDTILCFGETLILDAYQPYNRNVLWQDGSMDSIFIINNNMNGIYNVELTDTNGCQAFDTITVLYNHVTPQLRTDTSICYSTTIPVNGTYPEANISYLWSTGETTPIITATQDTTYWIQLTDSIGCQGSDTFNLSYDPIADLGLDVSYVCDSIFKTLDPGVANGTFLWQDGSTNPTFTPSVQGIYWVEIWDINGCYSTDTVSLIPVTSPIANIGSDVNVCLGQTAVLDATTTFIRQYTWQDGSGLPTFNAIATGEYIVEVIDSNGCNDFDTAMVWVNEVIPNLGADTSICNLTQLPLNAAQPNMIAYLWQDGSTNSTFSANDGLYFVTLTDTLGCEGTDSIFITYRQTADIGSDLTFVCDSVSFSFAANIPGIYQWSTGEPTATITNNQEGIYYLNIFDTKGCFSSDTAIVTQISHPTVSLGNDTTYCFGQTYLLDATESFVRSYAWQDGSVANTYLTNSTGLYQVELTDSFGCKAYDSVMVYVNEVVVNLGNDTTVCHDLPIIYNVTQPNMTYLWQDGNTNGVYTVTSPGTYSVTVTDTIGCNDSDAVTVSHFPKVNLGVDRLFKCDSSTVTVIPNFTSGGSTLWHDGTTTPIFIATQPQTVSIRYIDANSCISFDTMQIVPPPTPLINLGNDTTLCENTTYNISIFNGVGRSYLWHDGSTNDNFTIITSGRYYAEITDTNGCTNSDTIYIDYFLNEDLNLGNDTLICENIALQISLNVTGAIRYEWQDGTQGGNYTISTDGTYWVDAYDVNNCPISDTIIVTTEPVPSEILYLPTDTTICNKTVITVTAYAPYATDYLWEGESAFYQQNDANNTDFVITYPGTYSITASNRCAGITQFLEVEEEDCGCYPFVPNGFTPNGDGQNDVFKVFTNCLIQDFEMSVYDRWGNQVYFSKDVDAGWDGTFNGQELQTGVYVWQMRFAALDERGVLTTQVLSGDVTLVK